ncbi:hypothetical protein HPB47_014750 [Ixodes persulcatus]|uniref:Uncharacterized protein n=1 Tax=Ixodes persulcatus TaxID=34615 RepID=A0AC60R3H0_IXOPE|nr:hypothetical protein HPB47_014750 [Ixodes persulcatus]
MLHKADIHSRIAAQNTSLNDRRRKQRMEFASVVESWCPRRWRSVMFTDEESFRTRWDQQPGILWVPEGRGVTPRPLGGRAVGGARVAKPCSLLGVGTPTSFLVLGGGVCRTTPEVEGDPDGTRRTPVYEKQGPKRCIASPGGPRRVQTNPGLSSTTRVPFSPDTGVVFLLQQDGAPIHTARSVTHLFDSLGAMRLDWPARSLDPYIIKNVWDKMKITLSKKRGLAKATSEQLWEALKHEWENLRQDRHFVDALYDSIPTRIASLKAAQGGPIHH